MRDLTHRTTIGSLNIDNNRRIKALSKRFDMPKQEVVSLLLDVFELEDIDSLINQIQYKYREGLTMSQLQMLSVVFTQLSVILKPIL